MSPGRPVGSTGAEGCTAGLLMSGIHVITQRVALSGGTAQADITALIAAFFRHAVCGQIHLVAGQGQRNGECQVNPRLFIIITAGRIVTVFAVTGPACAEGIIDILPVIGITQLIFTGAAWPPQ